MINSDKKLIGIEDLAEFLSISKNTVYSWVNQRKIPYFKIGRLVKFDSAEIEIWLKERKKDEINIR